MAHQLAFIPIILYPVATMFLLFVLGLGFGNIILPDALRRYVLWLSPWITICIAILYFVIASLIGFSVVTAFPFLIIFLMVCDIVAFRNKKLRIACDLKSDILMFVCMMGVLLLVLSPLIRRDKVITTISFGNNDVIAYAVSGDYLKHHSLAESFRSPVELTVDNLLHDGYRWGTPIINAFFLTLTGTAGYQYTYISEAILYALFVPLVYVLFQILYKSTILGLVIVTVCTGLNANLLYMLYHDFYGQVLFWGLELLLFILIYSYVMSKEIKRNHISIYELLIGITITILYFSYHEPAVFLFAPLGIFLIFVVIQDRNKALVSVNGFIRIAFIALITGSISIVNAFLFDFQQAFLANSNQPIGWQLFRSQIPYANPFEAMGFYSIHNFAPLPTIVAILLSLIVIGIIIWGIFHSRMKTLSISYLLLFLLFFYWTVVKHPNFFAYNRALTYTLPFFIIFFGIGIVQLIKRFGKPAYIVYVILLGCAVFSSYKITKRFVANHLSVDQQYTTLLQLKQIGIHEPVYTESFLSDSVPLWRQIWTGYFVYSTGLSPIPKIGVISDFKNQVPHGSLVLIPKSTPWIHASSYVLLDTIWENQYYVLGHICNENTCLERLSNKTSVIRVGNTLGEDSMLIHGWGPVEGDARWINAKNATIRIVAGRTVSRLYISAHSYYRPQRVTIYVDNILQGNYTINTEWKKYNFPLLQPLNPGVHEISLNFQQGYQPSVVELGNADTRLLYIDVKEIGLE